MRKKISSKSRVTRHEVEKQEVIKEVPRRGTSCYETVRLSRIKYFDNDDSLIDLRIYQRGYDDDNDEVFSPTKKGVQIKEELFFKLVEDYFVKGLEKQMH